MIIEINGIKMEVDERYAKRIDEFRVGDKVKALVKEYSEYRSFPAVITGFDAFQKLPTITIAYLGTYGDLKFTCINANSTDVEIVPADDAVSWLDKDDILARMDREINVAEEKVKELAMKKKYFLERFGHFFKMEQE